MQIVIITGGKNDDHYLFGAKTFDSLHDAEVFCEGYNKSNSSGKYWRYAEIVSEGVLYEVDCEDHRTYGINYIEH